MKKRDCSFRSLTLPTKSLRANKIPVTQDTPSLQKLRKSEAFPKECHLPNQRHAVVSHKTHQNPENIQFSEQALVVF